MDVISDVLSHFPVKGYTTGVLNLRGDWAFESPQHDQAVFHLVSKGSVLIKIGSDVVRLQEGDISFFSRGHPHVLSSGLGAPLITFAEDDTKVRIHTFDHGQVRKINKAGEGPEASLVCARFDLGHATAKLLTRSFPDHMTLLRKEDDTLAWLNPLLRQIAVEAHSNAPGALAALDSLLNMLFVQFMRHWFKTPSPMHSGWFQGLLDPHVSDAFQLLHETPAHNWSVAELAEAVGMSRSNFAARFAELVGEPPLRYLTRWRLILAAKKLESEPTQPLSEIALSVGYDSEASFSAAFKRQFGQPPGAWRAHNIQSRRSETKIA